MKELSGEIWKGKCGSGIELNPHLPQRELLSKVGKPEHNLFLLFRNR